MKNRVKIALIVAAGVVTAFLTMAPGGTRPVTGDRRGGGPGASLSVRR